MEKSQDPKPRKEIGFKIPGNDKPKSLKLKSHKLFSQKLAVPRTGI
jgi:hypothetical protein